MLTDKDHKVRSRGIGSSEIAMLIYIDGLPLSPWGGRHALWRRKTGRESFKETKSFMARGNYLEPGLIQWYADDHNIDWIKPPTENHSKFPYVVDSCDGLTYPKGQVGKDKPLRCIEAKTMHWTQREKFGTEGTDEIPLYYITQGQWHLGHHQPQEMICDYPVDEGSKRLDYSVQYDEELYLSLVMEAEKFWKDYVLKDKEPPIDDAGDTCAWLSKWLKNKEGSGYIEADSHTINLLLRYKALSLNIKSYESEIDIIKEQLMRVIDMKDGIIIPDTKAKVTWKKSKDRETIDFKKVAEDLAKHIDPLLYKKIKDDNTKIIEGSRRWVPTALINAEFGK